MSKFRIVPLNCGILRGEEVVSKLGKKYISFKGIPYARPPVENLRFKPPEPLPVWEGVKDAFKEGNRAPQFDMITKEFVGSEDCLYLNVYTPEIPENNQFKLKPVMFWIHGGGYAFGHGDADMYGPDLLVHHDVVLVTANYRLGILGFLNLELEEASGNMGLKDQVAALRWVKKDIEAFGGDSNNITIFGNSAGGASVHLHMLSDMSKGLFNKAIAQSGNALCSWSFTTKHKERAFALGNILGFQTDDEKELFNFFVTVPPIEFAKHQDDIMTFMDHLKEVDQAFVPSIEKEFSACESFISSHPKYLLRDGKFQNIPFIIGINSHEGITAVYSAKKYPHLIEEMDSNFHMLLPISEVSNENAQRVRDFYFDGRSIGTSEDQLIKFYTDIIYLIPSYESLILQLKNNHKNIYFYQFSHDGKFGWYKRLMAKNRNIEEIKIPSGTQHADELGYLFSNDVLNLQDLTVPSTDLKVAQIFTSIWTNFAKSGEPSIPESSATWTPVTEECFNFLNISENVTLGRDHIETTIEFWKNLDICTPTKN